MDETDLLALLSGEDPSAQEKAAAMAQALRRQRAAGNLGLLTGDRVLGGFGHAQIQGAQAGEALQERRADRSGDARARMLTLALSERDKSDTAKRQAAQDAANAAERKIDNARADQGQVLQAENNRLMRQLAFGKDARAEAKAAKGKDLPESAVEGIADLPTAMEALQNLGQSFKSLDMGSTSARASGMLPTALGRAVGTDVSKFQSEAQLAMQGIGKIMEGGKLAAGDEQKYRSMLPQAGDDEALAMQKIEKANAYLKALVSRRLKALAKAGYNVPPDLVEMPKETPMTQERPRVMYRADGTEVEVGD